MDLISIYNRNKIKNKLHKELEKEICIERILEKIVNGEDTFTDDNHELFDSFGIKYTKTIRKNKYFGNIIKETVYTIKLNKTNITKIQNYLNKQEAENE